MKKFVKVLSVVLVCIICIGSLSGCSNQPKLTTVDEVVQALKDAGYTDAYHTSESATVYLSLDDNAEKINFSPLDVNVDNIGESELYIASSEYHWYKFMLLNIDEEKDYSKVLDTIMPFFDSEYDNNGSEIMEQLWEYNENSEYEYLWNDGDYTTKHIVYERDKYTVQYYLSVGQEEIEILHIQVR